MMAISQQAGKIIKNDMWRLCAWWVEDGIGKVYRASYGLGSVEFIGDSDAYRLNSSDGDAWYKVFAFVFYAAFRVFLVLSVFF